MTHSQAGQSTTGFPRRLKDARTDAGLTQQALADKLGMTQTAVSYWESGERDPSLSAICRFCEVLNVTADWLVRGVAEVEDNTVVAVERHVGRARAELNELLDWVRRDSE